jgi:hypothetical protein
MHECAITVKTLMPKGCRYGKPSKKQALLRLNEVFMLFLKILPLKKPLKMKGFFSK